MTNFLSACTQHAVDKWGKLGLGKGRQIECEFLNVINARIAKDKATIIQSGPNVLYARIANDNATLIQIEPNVMIATIVKDNASVIQIGPKLVNAKIA